MPSDYSGQNLRGRSFKGQNLSGKNFSGSDITGADFSNAILRGTNFTGVKAGVQKRWITLLVLFSLMSSLVLGDLIGKMSNAVISFLYTFFNLYQTYFTGRILVELIGIILSILTTFICVFIIISQEVKNVLGLFSIAFVFFTLFGNASNGAIFLNEVFAIVYSYALAIALTGIYILSGIIGFVLCGILSVYASTAAIYVIQLRYQISISHTFEFNKFICICLLNYSFILFSIYMSRELIKGNEKYGVVRNLVVSFAAFKGTSFHNADLTEVNFTEANLKSTDFTKAILTRTCFRKSRKLDLIRPGYSYLRNTELRQLLITGDGQGKSFKNLDLKGINLSGANLAYTNLIGTNFYQSSLKQANLEGSLLVRTQFESTDLTAAILTGACIEDWVVTKTTKLYGVKCKYIFMKLTEKGDKRDQMPPTGEFTNDDFVIFVQSIIDTIKLYHQRDVNPNLALYVLQSLSEDYQCTLEIIKFEKRGENGAIIEVKISGNLNEEQLKETYYEKYNHSLRLYMTDPKKELKSSMNIENITIHKGFVIGGNVSESIVTDTIYNQGDNIMSESYQSKYDQRNSNNQFVDTAQSGSNVTFNQNSYSPQQKQNLVEAAAEIQQLLYQLSQTNSTTDEAITEAVYQEIKRNPTLKVRLQSALKAGGLEALKAIFNHPLFSIPAETIKGWLEAE